MKKVLGNKWYIFLLCAPAMLLLIAFVLYPILNIVVMSLQKTDGLTPAKFIGFKNFVQLFTDDGFMRANLASLGLCLLAVICNAILAIAVSILLCTLGPKTQKILRTAFIIPLVLSISVISQLWLTIYHADWGLLNTMLDKIGLGFLQNEWLINPKTAMVCIAIVGMWWMFGMDLLMSYSGIKAIPESYFEAAQLDGAGFWQTVRHITLPLLKDVAKMCVTISAIGGLFTFPQVYIMTGGGPGDLTTTVMMYMYKQAFSNQRYGLAAAVGLVVILETCVVLAVINWLFKKGRSAE
ncbi:carbohydrate ABC transporter permease [Diplocloster agilis]|uniref:Sugar ABC transporter permease n=1 Tax=Diplocloster agilis TaxID=2850323 RepID=A0A949K1A3_9FIRM|nr:MULTISPECIES: sugar ABC transporter permease [Lachnospiraceae]MBU9736885.1 sugar ABC transporter permease [Diplocloster agilis]MBU9743952.1 sugar ABC transporter permease [Diplocloster agilis]MCU6733692.1 sugar ABC transporter permease [Suonthocola fibrivorans]SCJ04053.1 sn-glycerol-3-phosphate transport system permease protein ugpA [uncultured Clostridium sp.]